MTNTFEAYSAIQIIKLQSTIFVDLKQMQCFQLLIIIKLDFVG